MNILICGAGFAGVYVAQYLAKQGNRITLVDSQEKIIESLNETMDIQGVVGHISDPDILIKAGIEKVDAILTLTKSDELNMITCQVADTFFQVPITIARIRRLIYLESKWANLFREQGIPIDLAFSPEQKLAERLLEIIQAPGSFDSLNPTASNFSVLGITPQGGSTLLTAPIGQIESLSQFNIFQILAIFRRNRLLIPTPSTILRPRDKVYVLFDNKHRDLILSYFNVQNETPSNLMYMGENNILESLVKEMESSPKNFVLQVVESDLAKAKKYATNFNNISVIGDNLLQNQAVLERMVENIDAVLAMTPNDEDNILLSILTKSVDIEKETYALLNYHTRLSFSANLGITVPLSIGDILMASILPYVRRGSYRSIWPLLSGLAEIWEYEVPDNSILLERPLNTLTMPKGSYLTGIVRKDHMISRIGNHMINVGDILFLLVEQQATATLEDFLLT